VKHKSKVLFKFKNINIYWKRKHEKYQHIPHGHERGGGGEYFYLSKISNSRYFSSIYHALHLGAK
jgi:hypothetical protein